MARRDTTKPVPYRGERPPDGPSEKAQTGALIDCIMGVPVSEDRGYPSERVASLRSQVKALQARGVIVDIPWSGEAFDDDDEYPDEAAKAHAARLALEEKASK